ncbi:hypothetical protein L1987_45173 [Smallanthus sonchifolius]|uniref:Uncharacterized protein n=1 Tax=Smallanthus sonchifolius TaxID=185202 RepID=A0ACB9GSJ8_9ASTR|nr:hypothetical protein L1987_45173 [Smallanthus sonchifolius]
MHKLPTIDFTNKRNLKPGSTSWLATSIEATRSLEEYGCFIAEFDKVTTELNDTVFKGLQDLFDLPTEVKVQNKSAKPSHGYAGQIPTIPLFESMGFDYSNTPDGVKSFVDVMWPNGNEAFSATVLAYNRLAAELEEIVTRMVFETYGVEKNLDAHWKMVTYLCRVMRYRAPEKNDTNIGLVPHTDKDFITVLHQNGVNGLEVKARDGQWFSVELKPSSHIVILGDEAMAWSNGRKQSRKEFVDEEHPLLFKPFDHLKFLEFCNKPENRALESAIKAYCGV